jgi:hypothetical protein
MSVKKDVFNRPDYWLLPAGQMCEFANSCNLPCRGGREQHENPVSCGARRWLLVFSDRTKQETEVAP